MTIAKTHELKNQGAFQTKKYFEKVESASVPYKAVFVVPKDELRQTYRTQAFTGNIKKGKTITMEEAEAKKMMEVSFRQWVIELGP